MSASPVILITGASSGIGRACAEYLHERNYRVYGTSRTPQNYTSLPYPLLQMDVTDGESIHRAIVTINGQAGRIDGLVNNAGVGLAGAVEDTSIAEAKAQFEVNFFGALQVSRNVLPLMRKQGGGHIIFISSIAGRIALPFQALYSASKFAMEGMAEALRMEVRPYGIKVVLIEPGDFRTDITANRRWVQVETTPSPYYQQASRAVGIMARDEQQGPEPVQVARLLHRILRHPSPRLRYTVDPWPQRVAVFVKRFLPHRLLEWMLMTYYQLK